MKTLPKLGLLLGALCGAACVALASSGVAITNTPAKRPANFQKISEMQMFDTMKGRKRLIDWTCYVEFTPQGQPVNRNQAWLEGNFKRSADQVDLWDIGAQHRTHQLLVRLVPSGSHKATLTQVTGPLGEPCKITPLQDGNGFYLVEGSLPNGGTAAVNSYIITTDDPTLHLDVIYVGHIPGVGSRPGLMQTEDGGPPSIPPVSEN